MPAWTALPDAHGDEDKLKPVQRSLEPLLFKPFQNIVLPVAARYHQVLGPENFNLHSRSFWGVLLKKRFG